MNIIEPPTIELPNAQEFGLKSNTRTFTSPFTGYTQSQSTPGSLWFCKYKYPPMKDDKARQFKAFLMKLRGQANAFTAKDFNFTGQSTTGITATATLGANILIFNIAVTLAVGDYIKVGDEFKQVTEASTGKSATIEPPFRDSHTGSAVELEDPTCSMLLDVDSVMWSSGVCNITVFEFAGVEVFA